MSTPPAVAYYSPRMGFLIQAGTDQADYGAIIDALLKTDGASGLVLCTEGTKPSTNLFPGMYVKCTDSGKHYFLQGGSWSSGVYSGGTWQEDFYLNIVSVASGNGNMIYAGRDTAGYSLAWDQGVSNVASGKATTTVATVTSGQVVDFEIQLDTVANFAGSTFSDNSAGSVGALAGVYLTIDGTDNLIANLYASDFKFLISASAGLGVSAGGHNIYKINCTKSIAAAGNHTCSVKVLVNPFTVTNSSGGSLSIGLTNLKAMVSVA